jgi:hypothetical protein
MFKSITLALTFLASSAMAATPYISPIPLSKTGYAFSRGDTTSDVTIDLWIDLGCSDCMNEWPLLTEVYSQYESKVKFSYHLFPLPYHQFAFLLNKSVFAVGLVSAEEDDVFKFIDAAYLPENQALVYNSVTADTTYNEMLQIVGGWVANSTSVDFSTYLDAMANNGDAEMNTRYSFKASALAAVYGTPR